MKNKKLKAFIHVGIPLILVLIFYAIELVLLLRGNDFVFTPLVLYRSFFLFVPMFLLYIGDELLRPILKGKQKRWLLPLFFLAVLIYVIEIPYEIFVIDGTFSLFFKEKYATELLILWFDEFLFFLYLGITRTKDYDREKKKEENPSVLPKEEK